MIKGFARFISRLCASRRGDCMGMAAAGTFFMTVPADAASKPVFYNMGLGMLALGLAATAAGITTRRE